MTIDEAIESLEARVAYGKKNYPDYPTNDVQLGIEALKRIKRGRRRIELVSSHLLPRETEE